MRRLSRRLAGLFGSCLLVAALGCKTGPQYCDVKGTVTFDGRPLPGGSVQITDEANTQMVFADLNIDGEFKVNHAPAGPVRVVVRTESAKTAAIDPKIIKILQAKGAPIVAPDPKEKGNKFVAIPAKYNDREQSGLKFDLKPNTLNELKVELTK